MNFKSNCLISIAAIALPLVTFPERAIAQEEGNPALPERVDSSTRGPIEASDRISGLGYRQLTTDAQLSSDDGSVVAHLSLDYAFSGKPKTREVKGVSTVTGGFTNISVKLAVPLNSSEPDSEVDFRTFGNQAKFTLNFNHYNSTFAEPGQGYEDNRKFAVTCLTEAGKAWKKQNSTRFDIAMMDRQILAMVAAFKADGESSIGGAMDSAAGKPDVGEFGGFALNECRPGKGKIGNENDLGDLFAEQTLGEDEYKDWRRKYRGHARLFYFGGEVRVGYSRFAIANPTTIQLDRVDRVGFDANFHAGFVFPDANLQVSLGGGYTRSFKSLDEVEVCAPLVPNVNSRCIKGLPSVPVAEDTGYVEIKARSILLRKKDGTPLLGIAPTVTYIFEDKDFQVSVPLYFQRSQTGGLDAGVKAIWNNKDQRFGIGAFVGVPF